jgi:hypothetical protein
MSKSDHLTPWFIPSIGFFGGVILSRRVKLGRRQTKTKTKTKTEQKSKTMPYLL